MKRFLLGLMRSYAQTSDKATDLLLRSHYYRMSTDNIWEEIVSTLKKMQGYKVLHTVESVGEIVLEKKTFTGRTMDITVSIVNVGAGRSSVDIYSASRGSLGDLGSNFRVIQDIYAALDRKLSSYKTTA